jgi:hypothetical protein
MRGLAELATSTAAHHLTLTYGDRGEFVPSTAFQFENVQKAFKRIRKAGYPVRYMGARENGPLKGRAHFHLIVFWKGEVPPLPPADTVKQMWDFWPHGFTYVQSVGPESLRYVIKYARKDLHAGGGNARLIVSLKPGIGAEWIRGYAEEWARQGLFPRELHYEPPGSPLAYSLEHQRVLYSIATGRGTFRDLFGLPRKRGWLTGSNFREFCRAWLAEFRRINGEDARLPNNPHLTAYRHSPEGQNMGMDGAEAIGRRLGGTPQAMAKLKRGRVSACGRIVVYVLTDGRVWAHRGLPSTGEFVREVMALEAAGASAELVRTARGELGRAQTFQIPQGDFRLLRRALAGRWWSVAELRKDAPAFPPFPVSPVSK